MSKISKTFSCSSERKLTRPYFVEAHGHFVCPQTAPVYLVCFQWYLKCSLIKTLDKHWIHPVSICSALYFRGLFIVATATLQIFVGTVRGQARVCDQVLKLTEAPLQLSVLFPSPIWHCFIELFLRPPSPPSSSILLPTPFEASKETPIFITAFTLLLHSRNNCQLLEWTSQRTTFTVCPQDCSHLQVVWQCFAFFFQSTMLDLSHIYVTNCAS